MRMLLLGLALSSLTPLSAQDRLLQAADLPARRTAVALLEFGLEGATNLPAPHGVERLRAALATARDCLPTGSRARQRADAIVAAGRDADGLRLAVAELADDLAFQPVDEAPLPEGLPGFRALDEIELRHYPTYRMVRSPMRGGAMGAFWPLFEHIQQREIAMTTPVQIDWRDDGQRQREATMAFLYGSPALGPTGQAGKVEVVDVPALTVLSLGARGHDRPSRIAELREQLTQWLGKQTEWEAAGPIRTMGYNSPSVGGDRRYFEVQMPIRRTAAARLRESL